jgi:hypothetical protein
LRDEFTEHIHEVLAGLEIRFRRLGHWRDDNRRMPRGGPGPIMANTLRRTGTTTREPRAGGRGALTVVPIGGADPVLAVYAPGAVLRNIWPDGTVGGWATLDGDSCNRDQNEFIACIQR